MSRSSEIEGVKPAPRPPLARADKERPQAFARKAFRDGFRRAFGRVPEPGYPSDDEADPTRDA